VYLACAIQCEKFQKGAGELQDEGPDKDHGDTGRRAGVEHFPGEKRHSGSCHRGSALGLGLGLALGCTGGGRMRAC
jgi:S-adenosylmethionine synthetase